MLLVMNSDELSPSLRDELLFRLNYNSWGH